MAAIERRRVDKLRRKGRNPLYKLASDLVITHMAESTRHRISRFVSGLFPKDREAEKAEAAAARERWNLGSLRYGTDDLDRALDYMAVCPKA